MNATRSRHALSYAKACDYVGLTVLAAALLFIIACR